MKCVQHAAHNAKNQKDGIIQTSLVVVINISKDLRTWLKVATTLEKPSTHTHFHIQRLMGCSKTPCTYEWYVSTAFTWELGMYGEFCYFLILYHGGLMHDILFHSSQYTPMAALYYIMG